MENQIKITITGPENGTTKNISEVVSMAIKKMMSEANCVIVFNNMGRPQHPSSDTADIVIDVLKK